MKHIFSKKSDTKKYLSLKSIFSKKLENDVLVKTKHLDNQLITSFSIYKTLIMSILKMVFVNNIE